MGPVLSLFSKPEAHMVHSPPGEPPGGISHVNIGGQIVAMHVPPGVVAGQTLQNQVPQPQQLPVAIQVPQPQQAQQMRRHTRVLWDIENVSIPSGINTEEAVRALERWLETRGLWGAGVVGLITAFFNPEKVGTRMRDALNRANVTQVFAGSKREDADRRLVAQLWRDLELLPIGAATAVVFITADKDFIEQLRRVKERGGPTVLLTTAPLGSAHYNALANSATETHLWRDIVCTAPAPAAAAEPPPPMEAAAEKAAAEKAAADKAAAEAEKAKAKKRAKKEKQKKKKNKKKKAQGAGATVGDDDDDDDDDDGEVAPPTAPPVFVPVRYEAKCTYWDGAKGFGFLSPVQHGGKELYVNEKALCAACSHDGKQRSLRRGDLVSYALGSNHKGPCAIDVKLVSRAPAHMDEQRNVRSGPPAVLGKKGNRRAASVQV
jgi:cold shock CspA family protein